MTRQNQKQSKSQGRYKSKLQVRYSFVEESSHFTAIGTVWNDKSLDVDILDSKTHQEIISFVVKDDITILSELADIFSRMLSLIEFKKSHDNNTH